jgi:hypothetical protein
MLLHPQTEDAISHVQSVLMHILEENNGVMSVDNLIYQFPLHDPYHQQLQSYVPLGIHYVLSTYQSTFQIKYGQNGKIDKVQLKKIWGNDHDEQQVVPKCKFFNTSGGCKRGKSCYYAHITPEHGRYVPYKRHVTVIKKEEEEIDEDESDNEDWFTNVYVTNLPPHYAEKQILDLFSRFGEITRCYVPPLTSSSRIALIEFSTHEQAKQAINELNHTMVGDFTVRVTFAKRQSQRAIQPSLPPPLASPPPIPYFQVDSLDVSTRRQLYIVVSDYKYRLKRHVLE